MGKTPAFLFYPSDWTRDLDDQDLEIEGAWIRICCRLFWGGGSATKTLDEWSKVLRKNRKKTEKILKFLLKNKISSGLFLDNQNITIMSRRMIKDKELSEKRQQFGKLGGNPKLIKNEAVSLTKKDVLVNQTPETEYEYEYEIDTEKDSKKVDEKFESFWIAYPKKKSKGDAEKAWRVIKPSIELLSKILTSIEQAKKSEDWNKDSGKYIPYPATWLRAKGWDDDYTPIKTEIIKTQKDLRREAALKKIMEDD